MISGGNATVFVSNMDNAVRFYRKVLGASVCRELTVPVSACQLSISRFTRRSILTSFPKPDP